MKLKYKIAQSTDLDTQTLIKKMISKLEDDKYRILSVRENGLTFYDDPWKLMWNFEAARRMNGGSFEIETKDGVQTATFSIYLSLIVPICILLVLSTILISERQYDAPLFFLAFYIVGVTIQMITIRSIAREMLNDVIAQAA